MSTLRASLQQASAPSGLPAAILLAVAGAALFTFSAYFADPYLLPLALLGIAGIIIAIRQPAWGLAIAFALVPAEIFALPLPTGNISPSEGLMAVVGLGWLLRWSLRIGEVSMAPAPRTRDLSLAALLLVVLLGLGGAEDPAPILRVLVMWSLFTCVYFQVQAFDNGQMRTVLSGLAVGGGILGLIGASQFIGAGDITLYDGGTVTSTQAIGTFEDPNYFAACLSMAMLPAAALVISDPRRNLWLLAPAGGALAGIALSLSRGGILGSAVGIFVFLLWRRSRRVVLVLLTGIVLLTAMNLNPLMKNQYFGTIEQRLSTLSDPASASNRPEIWRVAGDIFVDNPVLGVGLNQFGFEAGKRGLYEHGAPLENAHSIPWSLAAETGLAGLVVFFFFAAQIGRRAWRALSGGDRIAVGIALGLTAALAAFALQGLTVVLIRVPLLFGLMLTFAGMLTALSDRRDRDQDQNKALGVEN